VIGLVVHGEHADAGPLASASASVSAIPVPPPPPPDPAVDEVIVEAQAKIDKGDFATAIDELTAIERKPPDRADVHALLERAYTGTRNTPSAMKEAGLWLAADRNGASDAKLQEDVRNAALLKDAQDDALALLEQHMGMAGVDIVWDIAFGNSGKLYPQAAARAKHDLDLPAVRANASPALSVWLQFKDAKTCDAKHDLLDDAKLKGDARLLGVLQPYVSTRGCGFLSRSDCYPCMHHDKALSDAITAITARSQQAQ
jgi:serine/threonine-protein kinase